MTDDITPFDQGRGRRPRVLFFAHDSQGLGHVRRVLALSGELARRRPDVAMLALTSSFLGGMWPTPENLDLIKLPSLSRAEVYATTQPSRRERRGGPPAFLTLRERMIHQVALTFDPWLFLVDNQPAGLLASQELVPTLEALHRGATGARLVLGLRDIFDTPEWVRASWPRQGITRLLSDIYDQVLVYGDRTLFDVAREFALPHHVEQKLIYTGYIRKREPLTPAAELRATIGAEERPLIVVTTGSGYDGATRTRAYLQALAEGLLPDVASFVVAGPLMAADERDALLLAGRLAATQVVAFEERLTSWIAAADLVVGMAGYNTVTEALGYGKRLVLIPRDHPGEQFIRASLLADRGLARMLHPADLSPAQLAHEVRAALAAPPPTVDLDFGGLERAGEVLAATLR